MIHFKHWFFQKFFSALLTQNYNTSSTNIDRDKTVQCHGNYFDGNIKISEYAKVLRSELHGNISIGRFTTLNGPNIDIYAGRGEVTVGNFCSIARNVSLQVDSHNYERITTYLIFKNLFDEYNKDEVIVHGNINIGHDVWIGSHSIILGNTKIGTGAVVAANSVVNRDVPPYAIVGGSPAKIIKYRFEERIIEALLNVKWWDWDINTIIKNRSLFINPINSLSINEFEGFRKR
jgi:acetyltransferase-like isoleucine patch superfamily enzyme